MYAEKIHPLETEIATLSTAKKIAESENKALREKYSLRIESDKEH